MEEPPMRGSAEINGKWGTHLAVGAQLFPTQVYKNSKYQYWSMNDGYTIFLWYNHLAMLDLWNFVDRIAKQIVSASLCMLIFCRFPLKSS